MTEAEFSLIPPEEAHRYYKTEQGFWKEIQEEEVPENLHGKYITLRRNYLMNHLPETYLKLKESGRLNYHLTEINQRAHELMEMITEQLKENNQEYQQAEEQADFLKMVRMTETYGKIAEETILKEIIYSE
ncbi:MAG: TnpV protein [Oscillospiraceae bacterium]